MSRVWTIGMCMACAGCSVINAYEDSIAVGDWRLETDDVSKMDMSADGDGASTLLLPMPAGAQNGYDLDWEQRAFDEFELTFKCRSSTTSCEGATFVMFCEASGDGGDLDCTARSGWANPVFNWNRNE